MGIDFEEFLQEFDKRLEKFFAQQAECICCKKGCSGCCEKGDYPLTALELQYLMKGYATLDNVVKSKIQQNFANMQRGGVCPFLIDKACAVYKYRPIICRIYGLAYKVNNNTIKIPYCVNIGKNFAKVYKDKELLIEPININLDTYHVLSGIEYGEIRSLYDWVKTSSNQ